MSNEERLSFISLVVKGYEGVLSFEERKQLNSLIRSPEYRELHFETIKLNCLLADAERAALSSGEMSEVFTTIDMKLLNELAESERLAPKLERPTQPEEEPHKLMRQSFEKRRMSRFQKLTLSACAAIILLLVYLGQLPPEQYGEEVAVVAGQMNVQWADSKVCFSKGQRLKTNQKLVTLDRGVIEILFDDGVNIVVEGPAAFAVERGGVYMSYGRMFSSVSRSGLGFFVETPNARFIDQGTEFGVQADINGSSELHVIKGMVQLFAGASGNEKSSLMVTENKAVRYDADRETVSEVKFDNDAFVRNFNYKTNSLWRGETKLDLADIVSGGDGLGKAVQLIGIDPASGEYTRSILGSTRKTNNRYNLVPASRFIDGVFVPDGGTGKVRVSSTGLQADCPDTSGNYTNEIAVYSGSLNGRNTSVPQFIKDGRSFIEESLLFVHSNAGITFDLNEIRGTLPNLVLKSFTAKAAFPDMSIEDGWSPPEVDLQVLADGKVLYARKGILTEDGFVPVEVKLSSRERFLTVIITEGSSNGGNNDFPWGLDSLFLISPELNFVEQL